MKLTVTFLCISGQLKTRKPLDREKQAAHHLTVLAEDGGFRVAFSSITVLVADDNDNSPSFEAPRYSKVISQNSTAGTTILKVSEL